MNLNSINYETVNEQQDPGYFLEHENLSQNEPVDDNNENLHKAMLLQVYSSLDSFDKNNNTMSNPYKDRLTLDTAKGSIEIPVEVQKSAINQWLNLKKNKVSQNKINYEEKSFDMVDSLFQFLLFILIIFTLIYTFGLFRKGIIRF